jgi:hypothetical protein
MFRQKTPNSDTTLFSPLAERSARIRDERPYFRQRARAISAASWL